MLPVSFLKSKIGVFYDVIEAYLARKTGCPEMTQNEFTLMAGVKQFWIEICKNREMRETASSFKKASKDPCLISDIKDWGIFLYV
jgi:hypothetical protein